MAQSGDGESAILSTPEAFRDFNGPLMTGDSPIAPLVSAEHGDLIEDAGGGAANDGGEDLRY